MSLKLLWPTPVWEIETPELSDIVSPLLHDIKTKNPKDNTLLSGLLTPTARSFEALLPGLVESALIEGNYARKYSQLLWARIKGMQPDEWDPPHIHCGPDLVGVFYLQIQKGHGDLILVPSSSNSGLSTHTDAIESMGPGKNRYTRLYHRIEAKEGKLALMPSDLVHFVLPNNSILPRYSLALNFKLDAL
jgi:hypothetical protein